MNSLFKEPFIHKAHDLIAFKIFYLKELFLRMTKEMTPSIRKLERTKPNLNWTYFCTPHGARSARSAHRGP
jgi:hypothetical protein